MVTKTAGVYRTRAVGFAVILFVVCACSKMTAVQIYYAVPIFRMC